MVTFMMQLIATAVTFYIMINSFESESVFRIAASITGFVIFFTFACLAGFRFFKNLYKSRKA